MGVAASLELSPPDLQDLPCREVGALAWYRNPTTGRHSLQIPYVISEGIRGLAVDFVFVHQVAGELLASLIRQRASVRSAASGVRRAGTRGAGPETNAAWAPT
jgi:hypothetical protein